MSSTHVSVVVGAQYGSEGKGHVTQQVIRRHLNLYQHFGLDDPERYSVVNVRVAGPNAGHTVYDSNGAKYAFQQIPVGAIEGVECYIAPGSEIRKGQLERELGWLKQGGHDLRLRISGEATVIEDQHIERERQEQMHERLGSTAHGIGAARADRIMRTAKRVCDDDDLLALLDNWGIELAEPHEVYGPTHGDDWNQHRTIVIEGTQGYGLGLHQGHYPKCTSSDTRAVDFLSLAGLSTFDPDITVTPILCARAYPIRVAGESGPMEGETTWEALGLPEERTTVTQKVRRVAEWDADLLRRAVRDNGGRVEIALTMVDQKFPEIHGATRLEELSMRALDWAEQVRCDLIEAGFPVTPVTLICTSPTTAADRMVEAAPNIGEEII